MTDFVGNLTLNEVVDLPQARNMADDINELNDTAKRKMFESLLDKNHPIAVGIWVLKVDTDIRGTEYCGCLMMDGVLDDKVYLDDNSLDVQEVCELAKDEDKILKVLYEFYGYDLDEIMAVDSEGYTDFYDHFIRDVSQSFDKFVREFREDFMITHGFHGSADNGMAYGLLNTKGREAVLAVFSKYVTVPPPNAPAVTQ